MEDLEATPDSSTERARKLAEEIAIGPVDEARLQAAWATLESSPDHAWLAFDDGFVERLRRDPALARAWVGALAAAAQPMSDDPESFASRPEDTEAIRALIKARREMLHPFEVWRDRQLRTEARHEHAKDFPLALRISPKDALRAMERLRTLGMIDLAMMNAHTDRALIEEMISTAPLVFDSEGRWLEDRCVTALFVIEQIVKHVSRLDDALRRKVWALKARQGSGEHESTLDAARTAPMEAREKELPGWVRQAFGLVLARPDGHELAAGYLAHLARSVLMEQPPAGEIRWSAAACALDALAAVLRDAGTTVSAIRNAWWRDETREQARESDQHRERQRVVRASSRRKRDAREGEGARELHGEGLPWVLGAAHVLGEDPGDQAELAAFWTWLNELLIGRDDALSFAFYQEGSLVDVTKRCGFLLSRLPGFDVLLRETYQRLEPQRRRSTYAFRYDDGDRDAPSVLLIRIGLFSIHYAIESLRKGMNAGDAMTNSGVEGLFFWLFDAARRLWLTAVLDTRELKSALVPLCFAHAPFLFGDRLPDALRRMVPPIANDPAQLGPAGWFLWRNHETKDAAAVAQRIRDAGADLEAALRDHHQWCELTRRKNNVPGRKSDFPDDLRALAAALGLELEAPPRVADGDADIKPRRQDFLRALPWGAALLGRLDEARCGLTRLWPIDAAGHAWALQLDLPSELQRDTGLAPALRILAVRGAPRGGDLRRVLEDPIDRARVDLDAVIVAGESPRLVERIPLLGGPWAQRVAWPFESGSFAPFVEVLRRGLRAVDVFDRRDPVPQRALVGRRGDVDRLCAELAQGRAVGVFGLRKVGKTSLLRAVAEKLDPAGAHLDAPLDHIDSEGAASDSLVVLLDIQSLTNRTLDAPRSLHGRDGLRRDPRSPVRTLPRSVPAPRGHCLGARSRDRDSPDESRRRRVAGCRGAIELRHPLARSAALGSAAVPRRVCPRGAQSRQRSSGEARMTKSNPYNWSRGVAAETIGLIHENAQLDLPDVVDAYLNTLVSGQRLVLIFDELDAYARDPRVGTSFFDALENVRKSSPDRLSLMAAGSLGMVLLRSELGSSVFSRQDRALLEPFSREEAAALAAPFQEADRPLSADVLDVLYLASGGIPALLTYGLGKLWDLPAPSSSAVTAAFQQFWVGEGREYLTIIRDGIFDERISSLPYRVWQEVRSSGRITQSRIEELKAEGDASRFMDTRDVFHMLCSSGLVKMADPDRWNDDPVVVEPIPSVLRFAFPEKGIRPQGSIADQLVLDLAGALSEIHAMSLNYITGDGAPYPEALFASSIALSLNGHGWRCVLEPLSGAGYADLKVRHARFPDIEAVIEVKHWPANDYKQIHEQVMSYSTRGVQAFACIMIAHHKRAGWKDDYARECLEGKVVSYAWREAEAPSGDYFNVPDERGPVAHFLLQLARR